MQTTLRVFAMFVVIVGIAAAATTPKSTNAMASHQAVSAGYPVPPLTPNCAPLGQCPQMSTLSGN